MAGAVDRRNHIEVGSLARHQAIFVACALNPSRKLHETHARSGASVDVVTHDGGSGGRIPAEGNAVTLGLVRAGRCGAQSKGNQQDTSVLTELLHVLILRVRKRVAEVGAGGTESAPPL